MYEDESMQESTSMDQLQKEADKLRNKIFEENRLYDFDYEVYAYIVGIEDDILQISIVTDEMQEYDEKYLLEKRGYAKITSSVYKPYFCEFISDIPDNDATVQFWKNHIGQWVRAKVSYSKIDKYGNELNGTLLVATSPFRRFSGRIEFAEDLSEEERYRLDSIYDLDHSSILINDKDSASYKKVSAELGDCVIGERYSIRIYNVGQGNCIYIRNTKSGEIENRILFDIGMTKLVSPDIDKIEVRLRQSLGQMKPRTVILSHWDIDHILGVYLMKPEHYGTLWLAPDYEERENLRISIRRLAKYLYLSEKLYLVGSAFNGKSVYENLGNRLHLYKGKGRTGSCGINNNHGLLIAVQNEQNAVTVLPGDCEYRMWPDDIWRYLQYNHNLIVPHYCGAMSMQMLEENSLNQRTAVISVGDNTYVHPNVEHKRNLQQLGYDVIETRNKKWIDIVPEGVKIEEDFRMGVV